MTMWIVVHYLNEDSVEAVPETWYRRKEHLCAWPISKKSVKKLIEKSGYPNKLDYKWLPARTLGKKYGSLEEARAKCRKATLLSDLSANEDNGHTHNKLGMVNATLPSPPTLHSSKISNVTNVDKNEESNSDKYDSDLDPEYKQPTLSTHGIDNVSDVSDSQENNVYFSTHFEKGHYDNVMELNETSDETNIFKPSTSTSNGISDIQVVRKEKPAVMDTFDFQKLVLSSLAKMKYELSVLNTTVHSSQATIHSIDKFLLNSGQLIATNISNNIANENSLSISDMFPIKTEQDLNQFENNLKDSIYRNNAISKLSVLIGIKGIGDSVRRVISKMFCDQLLTEYSLLGFKKKKNFSQLLSYRLLIDTLRTHPKFQNHLDKEIDVPLATWLSHAKYRIKL